MLLAVYLVFASNAGRTNNIFLKLEPRKEFESVNHWGTSQLVKYTRISGNNLLAPPGLCVFLIGMKHH